MPLVSGPEGSGKSRLSQWLCERAMEVGAAQCFQIKNSLDAEVFTSIRECLVNDLRLQGLSGDDLIAHLQKTFSHDDK